MTNPNDQKDKYVEEVIEPGDKISQLAHRICVDSYGNSPAVQVLPWGRGFRGGVDWVWARHILKEMLSGRMFQTTQNDGAGGKPQFFTLWKTPSSYFVLGREIIAMCVDDIAQQGGLGVVMDNIVDIKKITLVNIHLAEAMLEGYGRSLKEEGLVNITGETAVMKHSVSAFSDTGGDDQLILNWGASCIGLSHIDKRLDGSRVIPGMIVVGFHERGYRCNGGTFFTNLLHALYGHDARKIIANDEAMKFVRQLIEPSKSYAKTIARLHGWASNGLICPPLADIEAIYHVTGGGIMEKVKGALPPGIGMTLSQMPVPPSVLLQAQEMSRRVPELALSDWKCHRTFHGGCGMLIVARTEADARVIIAEAKKDGIEASVVGCTCQSEKNEIKIQSRFLNGGLLSSEDPK
jgi:phosphoribosylaminoimidazole (AIR) synthetase